MLACLNEIALNYTVRDAVDGRYSIYDCTVLLIYIFNRNLNETYLQKLGIHYMPGWRDPWGERYNLYSFPYGCIYHMFFVSRPLTYGEVGCFLSHYFIWLKV